MSHAWRAVILSLEGVFAVVFIFFPDVNPTFRDGDDLFLSRGCSLKTHFSALFCRDQWHVLPPRPFIGNCPHSCLEFPQAALTFFCRASLFLVLFSHLCGIYPFPVCISTFTGFCYNSEWVLITGEANTFQGLKWAHVVMLSEHCSCTAVSSGSSSFVIKVNFLLFFLIKI